jgi:putative sigma-54 modulation protein
MIINFSFKQMTPSDSVRDYANDKSDKLTKYFEGKIHVTWTFSDEKAGQIAHCHLLGNHMDYFGETSAESFFAAVDQTIEKIEKQIRKHKEKLTSHTG